MRASIHVVVIVDLVELGSVGTAALDRSVDVAIPHQGFPDLGIGVRFRGAGHDPCVLEEGVRVQDGEELERLLEVIDHLLCGHVVGVAGCIKGANAGAVLAPFVFPERLVVAPIVLPVYGHVVQQVVAVEMFEDLGYVLVLSGFVAVLLVGSVAFVRPQAVYCPVVCWTRSRVGVPELRLQQKTAGVVEAAGVGDGAFVVATQGVLEGAALLREGESWARQEKGPEGGREERSIRRRHCCE